jgi:hypothetical protein
MICIDDAGVSYAPPLEASSRSTFPLYHYWLEVVIIGDVRVFLVTFSSWFESSYVVFSLLVVL